MFPFSSLYLRSKLVMRKSFIDLQFMAVEIYAINIPLSVLPRLLKAMKLVT